MDGTMIANLFILLLALVAGAELLKGVPPEHHAALLAALTGLGGVVLLGALVSAGQRPGLDRFGLLGFLAVVFATVTLVGGALTAVGSKPKSAPGESAIRS